MRHPPSVKNATLAGVRLFRLIGPVLAFVLGGLQTGYADDLRRRDEGRALRVKVLKGCENCQLPAAPAPCQSSSSHWDRAATRVPTRNIRIHAVSIPEQTEISVYTDIEVSTATEMYLPDGHIFRVKYAGPGILRDPPCSESFVGSNITTTNIAFPSGTWIAVRARQPVYVHMDAKNWSPYQIDHMTQDVYIYHSEW